MQPKIQLAARVLLGLIYFVFGLNGFLNFIPAPADLPAGAIAFFTGISTGGYFIPFLKATEVVCGLLLLAGKAAPLALVILAPVTIHVFLFHYFLTPGAAQLIMPLAMIVLHIAAATAYWSLFRPLFK